MEIYLPFNIFRFIAVIQIIIKIQVQVKIILKAITGIVNKIEVQNVIEIEIVSNNKINKIVDLHWYTEENRSVVVARQGKARQGKARQGKARQAYIPVVVGLNEGFLILLKDLWEY